MTVTGQLMRFDRLEMGTVPHIADRRHDSRFTVHLEVSFTIVDEKTSARITAYHPAILVNWGKEGCCLLMDRQEVEGFSLQKCIESVKLYYLLISLGNCSGDSRPFELKGSVRWIHGMKDSIKEGFVVGIELAPSHDESAEAGGRRVVGSA